MPIVGSSPDRAVRVRAPGREHCVVFLGKALNKLLQCLSSPRSTGRPLCVFVFTTRIYEGYE